MFDASDAATEHPPDELPAYNTLRYEEDYSYLRGPSKSTDWLDPLKFIPLNADQPGLPDAERRHAPMLRALRKFRCEQRLGGREG